MEIIEQRVGMTPGSADRAPWLFLHGAYRDASAWGHAQARCDQLGIASRAISLPGHGTSTMHKGELRHYSVRDYVRIVLAELEHATPKPILVGHGLGAWIALRVAEECELPGFVLINCPSLRGSSGSSLRVLGRHPVWVARNLSQVFESPWTNSESVAKALLGDEAPAGSESSCVLRELLGSPTVAPEKVGSKVLVLASERSCLVPLSAQEQLGQKLSNATLATIPEAPHDVYAAPWASSLVEAIESWSSR